MKRKASDSSVSNRDWKDLFVHTDTLSCVTSGSCIPCMYKIYPEGRHNLPPNQRPEMCGRSKLTHFRDGLYRRGDRVLTVGDGDFSFSRSLSEGLCESGSYGHKNLVATSHESSESVLSVYRNSADNIAVLKSRGVTVLHGVDATDLKSSIIPACQDSYLHSFDAIVWNFPCISAKDGADAQADEIEANQRLLTGFFTNVSDLLCLPSAEKRAGEVHVSHKTIEPFCWWNIIELATAAGLRYEGSMVFDRYLYPGYINRKALDNKSFPFFDAQTYVFTVANKASEVTRLSTLQQRPEMVPLDEATLSLINSAISRLHQNKGIAKSKSKSAKKRKKIS